MIDQSFFVSNSQVNNLIYLSSIYLIQIPKQNESNSNNGPVQPASQVVKLLHLEPGKEVSLSDLTKAVALFEKVDSKELPEDFTSFRQVWLCKGDVT